MQAALENQVAVITGASRGLGKQIAHSLAAAGATVALIARSGQQLDELATEIEAAGGHALALPADVTDRAAVEATVAKIEAALGPVSILVNNAGVDRPFGPIGIADPDEWWQTQAIHVRGSLLFMHALIPGMRERGVGRIINMASRAALIVAPAFSSYCVAKSTLLRLTEHVDLEIKDAGLAAFVIHPGTIMTEMGRATLTNPEAQKWAKPLVAELKKMLDTDPTPALKRLGEQVVKLSGGAYDALSGRYLDLELELDVLLQQSKSSG